MGGNHINGKRNEPILLRGGSIHWLKEVLWSQDGVITQDPIQVACQDTDTTDIVSSVNHQECGGYLGQEGRRIPELRSSLKSDTRSESIRG